ncbi:MAG: ATP-dependent RNA helicase DbpA [Cellvibrionales bacterium]|nr:ATP-dependent RNA helicase DbpA [Cellvibrionales bacterium]
MNETSFSSLDLAHQLIDNLDSLGYKEMTAIQAMSLPEILAGKDVIAKSKTGSGKTAAFGLGLLAQLEVKQFYIQAMVLCPTRELADQVSKEIRRLARTTHNVKVLTLCGGKALGPQIGSLEHGAHIIVGTPGRIEDHINKGRLDADRLKLLVLDEADRMLEMGFQPSLDTIIASLPDKRQTLLFSATYPQAIASMAENITDKAQFIEIDTEHHDNVITEKVYEIDDEQQRLTAIQVLMLKYEPGSSMVFCNTKHETETIASYLKKQGLAAMALHGDLDQKDRDEVLVQFDNKSINLIVATDVAARGLDIDTLDLVVNYQIARDLDVHVHRVGRTGRAGNKGIACTLVSEKEKYKLNLLEKHLGKPITINVLPKSESLTDKSRLPKKISLKINGGKKQKLRPGDILGALTAGKDIDADAIGKINIFDFYSYVAVNREVMKIALAKINKGKIKGRQFQARRISL